MPLRPQRFLADWYSDPDDPAMVRYWDGHRWTEHVTVRDPLLSPDIEMPPPHETEPGNTIPADGAGRPAAPAPPRSRIVAGALLTGPVLGFFLPFFGPAVSAGAAYLAGWRAGRVLWTDGGWPHSRRAAILVGFAALWLLPFLNILASLGLFGPLRLPYAPGSAGWLFLPLAGPADPWTPATVALVVYTVGAALSAWRRRPWPWIAGGIAANVAYDLTIVVAAIPYTA